MVAGGGGVTQSERVLRALQAAGERGVTQVDFALPDVIDGGPPVTRVAARIKDLRQHGHTIVAAGLRQSCRVYQLVPAQELAGAATAPSRGPAYPGSTDGLFGAHAAPTGPRCAIYDDWEER